MHMITHDACRSLGQVCVVVMIGGLNHNAGKPQQTYHNQFFHNAFRSFPTLIIVSRNLALIFSPRNEAQCRATICRTPGIPELLESLHATPGSDQDQQHAQPEAPVPAA
jgi:hypothetical protein